MFRTLPTESTEVSKSIRPRCRLCSVHLKFYKARPRLGSLALRCPAAFYAPADTHADKHSRRLSVSAYYGLYIVFVYFIYLALSKEGAYG